MRIACIGGMKPLLLAGWLAAFGGDIVTTDIGLQQQAREVTLPAQNRAVLAGILAGQAGFGLWAYKRWHVTHPKLAKTIYLVGVATHGGATIWNLTQIVR